MSPRGSRIVAIVGRPNVGKSTLFNALIGQRVAIVDDEPGVTRDRVYHNFSTASGPAVLVDTGGLLTTPRNTVELGTREQALLACEEADLILFVVDGRVPPTAEDDAFARLLQSRAPHVVVVANKMDSPQEDAEGLSYGTLGLGEPLRVSALGRRGLTELRMEIAEALPPRAPGSAPTEGTAVAIIGKPNVGKSSLLNRLVGSLRAVVDEHPGTTRDAVDMTAVVGGHALRLIDTAGIRRKSRHEDGIGYYAYLRALGAVERCEVAAMVLDATCRDLEIAEVKLAQHVMLARKGLILVVNKWDLLTQGAIESLRWKRLITRRLGFIGPVEPRFVSARTGRGVAALPALFTELGVRRRRRFSPTELDTVVSHVRAVNPPPSNRGRPNRVLRMSQNDGDHPRFTIRVNDPDALRDSYVRYLRNTITERLHLQGIGFDLILAQERRRAR